MRKGVQVQVGNAIREVVCHILGPNYATGYVGKAYFCWKSDLYDLPYVKLNGKAADDRTRHLVKLFLMEYKKMLLANKKSPLHFKEYGVESKSVSTSNGNQSISGVPYWMREEHKVWTECHKKDGTTYMRRTRFKPESKEIVEKYLPFCSTCMYRVDCPNPCKDPNLMCQAEAFQKETVKVSKEKQQTSNQKQEAVVQFKPQVDLDPIDDLVEAENVF